MSSTPNADDAREALCSAMVALNAAERDANPVVRYQALAQLGRCYCALGAPAWGEWYLERALRWARMLGAADPVVDLLCELAEAGVARARHEGANVPEEGPRPAHPALERARDRGFEATSLVRRSADPSWEVAVLMRVSEVLERCGDHADAVALQCRAMQLIGRRECAAAEPKAAMPLQMM